MTECDCGNISPTDLIRRVCFNCKTPDNVDPWHYTGNTLFNNTKHGEFLGLCRTKLNKTPLPICVGDTGYVKANSDIFKYPNGWCEDEFGRTVILLDGLLMFQRYQLSNLLVGSPNGNTYSVIDSNKFPEFILRLESGQSETPIELNS